MSYFCKGYKMQLKLGKFYKRNNGSISIEFAIICPCLILMFAFVLELSRIMLIGSALDLEVAEISRKTAITENVSKANDYRQVFIEQLKKDIPWWDVLASADQFQVEVTHCNYIDEVIQDQCVASGIVGKILLFKINYNYSTMFPSLFDDFISTSLNKKAVVYREFVTN